MGGNEDWKSSVKTRPGDENEDGETPQRQRGDKAWEGLPQLSKGFRESSHGQRNLYAKK